MFDFSLYPAAQVALYSSTHGWRWFGSLAKAQAYGRRMGNEITRAAFREGALA